MPAKWTARAAPPAAEILQQLETTGLSPRIASLLAQRGVDSAAAADAFLHPDVARLHDPLRLLGMEKALRLLVAARERRTPVAVIGDYDVDGVTATALLLSVFQAVGIDAHGILPNRHAGGYGPQPSHMAQAEALGCRLVVTADCGIRAHEALDEAARRGLEVIVTDHHLPGDRPLAAAAVLNPRQEGCSYPFQDLAGVGLALKLASALLERCGRPVPWTSLCRIACLGTIADTVPLVGENRILASCGLAALPSTSSLGLRALLSEAKVVAPVSAHDVGFRLGPRLNAPGRLGSAEPALELLLTRDAARAREIATELGRANDERRRLERQVVDDCAARYSGRDLPPILVGWSPDWHRGVVGIAAGRLSREFHRPAILFSVDGPQAVASGRSVPGIDLHAFLLPWESRLARFGGHAQAIGLTAETARLGELAEEWERAAARTWGEEGQTPEHEFDERLHLAEVTPGFLAELARLEPFGAGNPEPVFRFGPCRRVGVSRLFGEGHLSFAAGASAAAAGDPTAPPPATVEVVAWRWAETARTSGVLEGDFELLAAVELDRYARRPRLRLLDAQPLGSHGLE